MKNSLPKFWSFNRVRDASMIKTEDLIWQGPFAWIGYEQVDKPNPILDIAGVYLFTFEYLDGYILRSVGVTNSMKRRLAQHTREYKKGNYTLLDVESAKTGLRRELWHGWQYAKEHQDIFLENKDVILIDGGMALRGRYNYEIPIEVKNICSHKLYGLPEIMEI